MTNQIKKLNIKAQEKLEWIQKKNNSPVCVGLDPVLEKLPVSLQKSKNPFFEFAKAIIDATHDLVCAYKFNLAFYEARGAAGIVELKVTCDYLASTYPEIFLIIDGKRADIDNTNEGSVRFIFDYLGADATTLNPYLGGAALAPFLARRDKISIILCRTSNQGAGEFQDLKIDSKPLYEIVAENVVKKWNKNGNCFLVLGATDVDSLGKIRKIAGGMTFLVPGIGAQGGDLEKTVKQGLNSRGGGLIINSSRGIIFASSGADFALKARVAAEKMREEVKRSNLLKI